MQSGSNQRLAPVPETPSSAAMQRGIVPADRDGIYGHLLSQPRQNGVDHTFGGPAPRLACWFMVNPAGHTRAQRGCICDDERWINAGSQKSRSPGAE